MPTRHGGNPSKNRGEQANYDHTGIGVIGATAITAALTDPKAFRSGRNFAPWIGLVQDSTGGKQKLGRSRNRATATSGAFSW